MKNDTLKIIPILIILLIPSYGFSQDTDKNYLKDPELLIGELYKSVSTNTGEEKPDWDKVKEMMHEKAVVTIRTTRTEFGIFDTQGYIDDFVKFYETPKVKSNGFVEKILKLNKTVAGDLAVVNTLYEAHINNNNRAPQQGVDSWQLIKKEGRWWVISIVNEIMWKKDSIPDILK